MARLSDAQRRVLENVRDGKKPGDHIVGMSAHGGFESTLRSCRVHGLLVAYHVGGPVFLTKKGELALRDGKFKKQRKDK